ncbi:MAG: TIGR01212 family radical SAM protein [bacterium]|nr:TIGR01212 family radical SAM protein [bacterium]
MKKPYYSLKDYFAKKYNKKIHKITIDAGFTCPTRDGTKGRDGCLYCDARGSGNGSFNRGMSVADQVKQARKYLRERHNAEKFFLYYQAFTNTYADAGRLKAVYDEGLGCDEGDIAGLIIGTRPDCVDEEKIRLIAGYHPGYEVWIEYGLQSIHQRTLDLIQRGHGKEDYSRAVRMTECFPVNMTTHIIVGLPHETHNKIMETIRFILKTGGVRSLKIHSLYIPLGSKLAELYQKERFKLMTRDEYIRTAADILEVLPPDIIISRLTGETSRAELLAPEWVLDKQGVIRGITEELRRRGSWQGKHSG